MKRALILCAALLAIPAHAAQVEVGAGIAQANTHGDGIWYQSAFPHQLDLRSPAFMVGLTGALSPHFAWHVDAVDLGSYSVNSWDTYQDNFYNSTTHQCVSHCGDLLHFIGSGHIYGIAATLEAHTTGAWQIGVEAGPFLHHDTWSVRVPNYATMTGFGGSGSTACADQWGTTTGVDIARTCSGWKVGAVVGTSLRHGPLAFSLRYYIGIS